VKVYILVPQSGQFADTWSAPFFISLEEVGSAMTDFFSFKHWNLSFAIATGSVSLGCFKKKISRRKNELRK